MTYPLKFREPVIGVRKKEGLTIAEASSRFNIGVATLRRWLKRIEPKTEIIAKSINIDQLI